MEARIARVESDVEHIRSDMVEVKADIRAIRDKMDDMSGSLSARIDHVNRTLTAKRDDVKDAVASAKIWALVLYVALAGAIFGTMARGFGWL